MARKYKKLGEYFTKSQQQRIILKFSEIEHIISERLPKSARGRDEWWRGHTLIEGRQSANWIKAGYVVTDLDRAIEKVTFEKIK